jgi:hypothetical protein
MIYSVQQIKFEVLAYIKECGTDFSAWYIGIASHPRKAMREEHGVDEELDVWFCKQAMSFRACDTIRSYFVGTLGVDGERESRRTDIGNCIYLFKKSERTRPAAGVAECSIVTADRSE